MTAGSAWPQMYIFGYRTLLSAEALRHRGSPRCAGMTLTSDCSHPSVLAWFAVRLGPRPDIQARKAAAEWTSPSNTSTSHGLYIARFYDEPLRLLRRTAPCPCEHRTNPDCFFIVRSCRTTAEMCTHPISQGMSRRSSALGRNAHNVKERDALCTLPAPPECTQHQAPLPTQEFMNPEGARCRSRASCVHAQGSIAVSIYIHAPVSRLAMTCSAHSVALSLWACLCRL